MNKIFLIFLLVIGISISTCFAQISFGPKLGGGISTFKEDRKVTSGDPPNRSYKAMATPIIGIVSNFQFGKYFALRPELLFLQRAAQYETDAGYSYKTRISYVELPINLVTGVKAGRGRFEVFAGSAFGLVVHGRTKLTGGGFDVNIPVHPKKQPKSTGDSYINPLNISMNFGLGYKLKSGFFVEVSYNLGLSNMRPHYEDSLRESGRDKDVLKASAVNFAIGFLFGKKK